MLKRHFYYYLLKPYLPVGFRMALRKIVAKWKRRKCKAIWPINDAAARPPRGWMGWPEGKTFAVVLTHDVEGPKGLARCRQLAELEMSLGFRSSFNFIPEGSYSVPTELRNWLTDNHFEVGVHDLKHDGKLYSSRAHFERNATRINHYLALWNAVGFRSGFMHHHQEWLHALNVTYDTSTFDTDPFEPQPDGVGTIFPFWVPAPNAQGQGYRGTRFLVENLEAPVAARRPLSEETATLPVFPKSSQAGFVELPYTLPQDSTLFMLFRESTNEIWRRKLDWIAKNGGMALINVHPDYLDLISPKTNPPRTVADHYATWLRYIVESYSNQFWHALPREAAEFARR